MTAATHPPSAINSRSFILISLYANPGLFFCGSVLKQAKLNEHQKATNLAVKITLNHIQEQRIKKRIYICARSLYR